MSHHRSWHGSMGPLLVDLAVPEHLAQPAHDVWHEALHDSDGLLEHLQDPNYDIISLDVADGPGHSLRVTHDAAHSGVATQEGQLGVHLKLLVPPSRYVQDQKLINKVVNLLNLEFGIYLTVHME